MSWNLRGLVAIAALSCPLCPAASAQVPMSGISSKMNDVAVDLSKAQTGKPVQEQQETIVRDLDEWIAMLEQQCQECRNGMKKPNPKSPALDSMIGQGPGGMGNLVAPGDGAKDWAKLSPRERDRILQSMSEGFPPEYRTVLERYYRRLAEEKAAPSVGQKAKDKDKDKGADRPAEKP